MLIFLAKAINLDPTFYYKLKIPFTSCFILLVNI